MSFEKEALAGNVAQQLMPPREAKSHSGWVTKRGAGPLGKNSWKRRWMVLEGGVATYYTGQDRVTEKGFFVVAGGAVGPLQGNPLVLGVAVAGRTFELKVEEDVEAWVTAFDRHGAARVHSVAGVQKGVDTFDFEGVAWDTEVCDWPSVSLWPTSSSGGSGGQYTTASYDEHDGEFLVLDGSNPASSALGFFVSKAKKGWIPRSCFTALDGANRMVLQRPSDPKYHVPLELAFGVASTQLPDSLLNGSLNREIEGGVAGRFKNQFLDGWRWTGCTVGGRGANSPSILPMFCVRASTKGQELPEEKIVAAAAEVERRASDNKGVFDNKSNIDATLDRASAESARHALCVLLGSSPKIRSGFFMVSKITAQLQMRCCSAWGPLQSYSVDLKRGEDYAKFVRDLGLKGWVIGSIMNSPHSKGKKTKTIYYHHIVAYRPVSGTNVVLY